MNFKELYTKNNIDYNCGKLFGPIEIIKDYTYSINKKGMKTFIPIIDTDYHEAFYAEIDEYDFFYDVLHYGHQLYNILKSNINPLPKTWAIHNSFEKSYLSIISEEIINDKWNKIDSICLDFAKHYTIGVVPQRYFPVEYKLNRGTPISFTINHILFIYMFHTVFANLSAGYNKYSEIYKAFGINDFHTDSEILDIIITYVNIYSMHYYHIMSYNLEIIRVDDTIIPFTITPNIFTFAFEVFQNNLAARSFYSFDEYNDVHSYVGFRKCSRCLKNISDPDMDRQLFSLTPIYKKQYCDDCKKELKRISSNKYEHSIRTLYDELKNNIDKCNPKLANEIRNLLPKDKETKTHLEKLYNEYQHDITKTNNKESSRT